MAKKQIYFTENQVAEIKRKLQQAREETNTNPTDGQKEAGNYRMGRVRIHGLDIAIENPKGSYRLGKDKNGKSWKCLMHNDYGYFSHTLGKDGDAVDVFIGNNLDSKSIFAIDQKIGSKFDETKVMLGFNSEEEAKNAYLSNYEKDWKGFWKITEVTIDDFKKWLYNGFRQRKPFSEYQEIKKKKLNESKDNKLLMESAIDNYFVEHGVTGTMNRFINDMNNGKETQDWGVLINPAMYQKALQVFMKFGKLDGNFPTDKIYQWLGIIIRNTIQLDSNTDISGHGNGYYPVGEIEESNFGQYVEEKTGLKLLRWDYDTMIFSCTLDNIVDLLGKNDKVAQEFIRGSIDAMELLTHFNEVNRELENNANLTYSSMEAEFVNDGNIKLAISLNLLLDRMGVFDWMRMPNGDTAWSDFGVKPLLDILSNYDDETTTPEQALVMINKCLDVTHQHGDIPSIFIEGGSSSLSQITHSTYLTESYLMDWEKEQIEDNSVNGTIKLYHNTTNQNLNDIINVGELDTHQHHSEGHGHMLFFTVNPDAWEVQSKISIEVPVKDFEDMTFRFVNNDSVITENNVPINKYNFKIEKVKGLEYDRIIEILTGNDERLKNYLLSDFFADILSIAEWFFNKVDYNF